MKFYRRPFVFFLIVSLLVCFFSSCTAEKRTRVKNYPVNKPFVFDNKIIISSGLPKDEKKRLATELENYWDDSLLARKALQFGLFYKLRNPPAFDSLNIIRTKRFMNAYLKSQGYYYAGIKADTVLHTYKDQERVFVQVKIDPGKNTVIDSIAYIFTDSSLQRNALLNRKQSLLKKGKPFSKELIASELDRLVGVFRDSGYFQISRDNIYAEVDTTESELLKLTIDPFEQARIIAEAAARRKKNPTIDVYLRQRAISDSVPGNDSSKFRQYYIGNIYFYPEAYQLPDSLLANRQALKQYNRNGDTVYYEQGKFVYRPLKDHMFLRKGSLYNEELFFKTLNNFNQIGAWQQVDTRTVTRQDSVDFHLFLTPAIKQNITIDLEASRNSGDFLSSGNLFGLALNTTYRNRNVWRRAIQSSTSFRNGVELSFDKSNPFVQTLQSTLSHTYSFPRFIAPFNIKNRYKLDGIKTLLNMSGTYSDRKDFFRLRSLITSWGYEWKKGNVLAQIKVPNIELYSLDTLQGLKDAFATNPYLRTSFNKGSVVSLQGTVNITYPDKNNPNITNYIRLASEWAGLGLLNTNMYQYIKGEAEYRRAIQYRKTSLVFRAFAGLGYNYGTNPSFGNTLPFFKQFVGGGPYSMRAWTLRQLGLGSSLLSDTAGTIDNSFRDRYGDMQLEVNVEYRYNIATISSMKLAGALFTDIGNLWNVKKDPNNPESEFDISRFTRDMAIGIGTGLRFDFNYFLIRLDFGLKLKDPARRANNGWLDFHDFTWRNYEFEKRDVNGNIISPTRNNFALQLGIGMPF